MPKIKLLKNESISQGAQTRAYTAHFYNGDAYVAPMAFSAPVGSNIDSAFKKAIRDDRRIRNREWTVAEIFDNYSLSKEPISIIKNDGSFKYGNEPEVHRDQFNFIFEYEGDSWFRYPKSVKELVKAHAYGKDLMDAFIRVEGSLRTRLKDTAIEVGHLVGIMFEENYNENGDRLPNPQRKKYEGPIPNAIKEVHSGFNRLAYKI